MSSIFTAIQWPFGIAVGTGVGAAAAGAITPVVQDVVNEAWETHPVRPPAAGLLAAGVAQGQISPGAARQWAAQTGFGDAQFDAMVATADTGPGIPRAFELWRRGELDEGGFRRACRREALEDEWTNGLVALHDVLLSPAEAANAWQQGYMTETQASDEALLSGVTRERSQIQRNLAGLPPGPETALAMLRRGIIDTGEFSQMIVEGNTKLKYVDEYLEMEPVLNAATTWASLWLKGWVSEGEAKAGGALVGYDAAAMERLYQDRGRPATVRQAHIGFQRGGRLAEAGNNEEQTIRRAVEESNIRSEWFDILYAQRFTYPSAFVLRALATDGTFTQAETRQILIESGWKPEWADAASAKWSGGGAGVSTKWADRAKGRLFTTAHNEFMDGSISEAQARGLLGRVGASGAEADTIIAVWVAERGIERRELTVAQVLKLYKRSIITRDEALSRLEDLDMDAADADKLLAAS